MNMRRAAAVLLLPCLLATPAWAQSESAEARLRDELRQTTLQLRQEQDTNAELRARQQTLEQQLAQLQQAAPTPKAAAPADAAELARLRSQAAAQGVQAESLRQQVAALQQTLAQWQQGYQKAADAARGRDAEARKYEAQYHDLDSREQACEQKNAELVRIGNELLERYKDKGFWDALKDDEPFTRIHRVQLEQAAQGYHARILDQKVDPAAAADPARQGSP
jgi:chromosome segregation ATPase